jgi:pyruvate kinase
MMNLPRRTSIIATIGTATESPEMLEKLIKVRMNIARINISHANESGLCYDGSTWGQSLGDIY